MCDVPICCERSDVLVGYDKLSKLGALSMEKTAHLQSPIPRPTKYDHFYWDQSLGVEVSISAFRSPTGEIKEEQIAKRWLDVRGVISGGTFLELWFSGYSCTHIFAFRL